MIEPHGPGKEEGKMYVYGLYFFDYFYEFIYINESYLWIIFFSSMRLIPWILIKFKAWSM